MCIFQSGLSQRNEWKGWSRRLSSWHPLSFHPPAGRPSATWQQDEACPEKTHALVHLWSDHRCGSYVFNIHTWKGMTRLIFSPTFLMNLVLRLRGRRIFGCSETRGEHHCEGTGLLEMNLIFHQSCFLLTHNLSDGDGLAEQCRRAAACYIHRNHTEVHHLSSGKVPHCVTLPINQIRVSRMPLRFWHAETAKQI